MLGHYEPRTRIASKLGKSLEVYWKEELLNMFFQKVFPRLLVSRHSKISHELRSGQREGRRI